jgi:hypothetical protein
MLKASRPSAPFLTRLRKKLLVSPYHLTLTGDSTGPECVLGPSLAYVGKNIGMGGCLYSIDMVWNND